MKNKKYYILFILVMIIAIGTMLAFNNSVTKEELLIKEFYPEAKNIELFKDISDDSFISLNFPGVMRAYKIDGKVKALISSCVGYNGPVDVLTAVGNNDEIIGIKIIQHEETLDYAEHLDSDWFLERFKNIVLDRFLNLVILDQENPEDIIQITGATISSKAVVTAVNASIGAYNYVNNGIKMSSVTDVIPQEMWEKEFNSFAINYSDQTIRIDMDELKEYPQVEQDVILINTTGTESKMKVKGPTLRNLLEEEGIDLSEFQAIGVTGRDGYYTMIDKEKLDVSEVILSWEVNGKPIDDAEKPVRIAMPDELGPYWVKMVSTIDLYDEISPKNIEIVHFFEPLTKDIEPYYYEYYGSKDKSIEIGKILAKFENVDTKGFFTMVSVDGLEKNETISLVRQRYFLKIEGENAPMNIAPNFKLGMNVKQMTHFSTTKDAVVFPEKMKAVVTTKSIGVDEGLLLEDVLKKVSMKWSSQTNFLAISEDGIVLELSQEDIQKTYLLMSDDVVMLYLGDDLVMKNLLRIEKYES